ncbi:MAG TPA: hypothetical protein VGK73_19320 [Polyangiaceae bacterium]
MMTRLSLPVAAVVLLLVPSIGAAEGEARRLARLELDAGDTAGECTSKQELEQRVQIELGRMVFGEGSEAGWGTIRVRLQRSSGGARFRAGVWLEQAGTSDSGAGEARELETSGDCHELDEELALVVALLADAELSAAQAASQAALQRDEPAPPPEPPAPVQDLSAVSSAPSWEARKPEPWRFEVELGLVAAFGILPEVAAGAELGASLLPPGWPALRGWLSWFVPAREELSSDAYVEIGYGNFGLALCPTFVEHTRFSLRGCAGIGASITSAESSGLSQSEAALRWDTLAALSLRFAVRWGGGWTSPLSLGAGIPTRVYRFTYEEAGRRSIGFEQAPIPAWASLGLTREFR